MFGFDGLVPKNFALYVYHCTVIDESLSRVYVVNTHLLHETSSCMGGACLQ